MLTSRLRFDCVMNTYGRPPWMVEESLESFLRQDYPGEKRLIINNDLPTQELIFEHPDVVVLNHKERFKNIAEKYNRVIWDHCKADYIVPWDDDDISLPWRLSTIAKYFKGHFFKPSQIFVRYNDGRLDIRKGLVYAGSAYSREGHKKVEGSPDSFFGEFGFYRRMESLGRIYTEIIPYEEIFYIWRMDQGKNKNPGQGQLSYYFDKKKSKEAYENWEIFGLHGDTRLNPCWRKDYVAEVREFIRTLLQTKFQKTGTVQGMSVS